MKSRITIALIAATSIAISFSVSINLSLDLNELYRDIVCYSASTSWACPVRLGDTKGE